MDINNISYKIATMKTLSKKIRRTALILLLLICGTSLFAGNPLTATSPSGQGVTNQQLVAYVAQLGANTASITTSKPGSNVKMITTVTGQHIVVYTSGDQIIGHEDLPY